MGVATDAKSKTEGRQIEMALLKACRPGDYGALDPTAREVCVRMFQNQSWALPDQLEITLPTSGELTLWKGIRQCLTYPGMKDSSNRERHEQAFLHVVRIMGQDRSIKSIWVPDIEDYQIRRLDVRCTPLSRQEMDFFKVIKSSLVLGECCPVVPGEYVSRYRVGAGSCT